MPVCVLSMLVCVPLSILVCVPLSILVCAPLSILVCARAEPECQCGVLCMLVWQYVSPTESSAH